LVSDARALTNRTSIPFFHLPYWGRDVIHAEFQLYS